MNRFTVRTVPGRRAGTRSAAQPALPPRTCLCGPPADELPVLEAAPPRSRTCSGPPPIVPRTRPGPVPDGLELLELLEPRSLAGAAVHTVPVQHVWAPQPLVVCPPQDELLIVPWVWVTWARPPNVAPSPHPVALTGQLGQAKLTGQPSSASLSGQPASPPNLEGQ